MSDIPVALSVPHYRWLYQQFFSEDANFKQKSRLRAFDGSDPSLGSGWAAFVASDAYLGYLSKYVHEDEVSITVRKYWMRA
jgi:hypothetical protein